MISDTANMTLKLAGDIITSQYSLDAGSYMSSWYLLKVDTPIQPFIFQRFGPKTDFPDVIPEADQEVLKALNAVEIQTVMRGGQNIDAHTFFNDEFLFGARVVYSAGYGMWQNAIKIQGSTGS
jgi:phage major head subunit gpT-like protein